MTIEEIRAEARRHRWTEGQVLFLADRVRNALVPLGLENLPFEVRRMAAAKLEAVIAAIEQTYLEEARNAS